MQEVKEKLKDEILEEIDALNDIDMNSEDYNPAVRGIGELTDKYIELEKIEADRAKSEAELAVTGSKSTAYLEISSVDVGEAAMTAIEKVLYGDETTDPRLPLPDEIAQIITEAQAA